MKARNKTKAVHYRNELAKITKKDRFKNMNEIELKSNSDLSNFLDSSQTSKHKNMHYARKKHFNDKIQVFEYDFEREPKLNEIGKVFPYKFNLTIDFERLHANQTADNHTSTNYLAQNFNRGKAKHIKDGSLKLDDESTSREKSRKIHTVDGVEVDTSSITVSEKNKYMPKNKVTKVSGHLINN